MIESIQVNFWMLEKWWCREQNHHPISELTTFQALSPMQTLISPDSRTLELWEQNVKCREELSKIAEVDLETKDCISCHKLINTHKDNRMLLKWMCKIKDTIISCIILLFRSVMKNRILWHRIMLNPIRWDLLQVVTTVWEHLQNIITPMRTTLSMLFPRINQWTTTLLEWEKITIAQLNLTHIHQLCRRPTIHHCLDSQIRASRTIIIKSCQSNLHHQSKNQWHNPLRLLEDHPRDILHSKWLSS